jgi:hypothetical protein
MACRLAADVLFCRAVRGPQERALLLFHVTNVTAAEAIKADGFKSDDGNVCLSSDDRSALGQARCGTAGPCALIELELDLAKEQLREYRIDDWDDPLTVHFRVRVDLVNAQLAPRGSEGRTIGLIAAS